MAEPFVNKVAESGLITLNLEDYLPQGETAVFDPEGKGFPRSDENLQLGGLPGEECGIDLQCGCHRTRLGLDAGSFLPATRCPGSGDG